MSDEMLSNKKSEPAKISFPVGDEAGEIPPKTAKANCRRCYGTGRIGYADLQHKVPVPCRCLKAREL